MNFQEWFTNFCQTIEKKDYVLGIVSCLDNCTLYLDIYLNGEPIFFHLSNGTLHYSYFNETYQIIIQYHYLNCLQKEYIEEINGYFILDRLKKGIIPCDKTKKLTYFKKLLKSSFSNPVLKLYQKEKSHLGF